MKHFDTTNWPAADADLRVAIREKLYALTRIADELVGAPETSNVPQPACEQRVQTILKARRSRAKFFEAELFADPAWDILLELYASDLGQRRISISSLCLGANVPATTALRWIKLLEGKDLIFRRSDPTDARRVFVFLSPTARDLMDRLFSSNPSSEILL